MDLHSHRERKGRMSVPQFGGWDQKSGGGDSESTNYTVVFSQARANRKQHKSELPRYSLGNDNELLDTHTPGHQKHDDTTATTPVKRRNTFLSWFNCFRA